MITIWHQTINSNDALFYNSGLIPVAIVPTNSLSLAAKTDVRKLKFDTPYSRPHLVTSPHRHTSTGDILSQSNGECWKILASGLNRVNFSLPHVAIIVDPEHGDMFESFPTLDLPLELKDSNLIERLDLPSYAHGRFYLETYYYWSEEREPTTRQLLRSYK